MPSNILIIESNEEAAAALKNLLRNSGLASKRVSGCAEALESISATPYDLVLLDMRSPGQEYLEFIKKLRLVPVTSRLPVIALAGRDLKKNELDKAKKEGVSHFLMKPVRTKDLSKVIRAELPQATTLPMPVSRHLARALHSRFSGTYQLNSMGATKNLVFFEGVPVHLSPGFFHRDFGRFLRHRNVISLNENSYFSGPGNLRDEALIKMGCLDYPELLQEKLVYLTEELVASFGHPPVSVTETPFPCPGGVEPMAVNLQDIFYKGYHRHIDLPQHRRQLEGYSYKYAGTTKDFFKFINFLNLNKQEIEFLGRIDGSSTLAESTNGDKNLGPLILTLVALRMIRLRESPCQCDPPENYPLRTLFNAVDEQTTLSQEGQPLESFSELIDQIQDETEIPAETPSHTGPESHTLPDQAEIDGVWTGLKEKNHYQVFGLSPENFSAGSLRERYFQITRKYGPETLIQLSGETAVRVNEILDRVATAYNNLCDFIKRERYDDIFKAAPQGSSPKSMEKIEAQVQARSGEFYIGRQDWVNAEKALQQACNLEPFNGSWMAHLAWASYRNAVEADSRPLREKARHMLNRSLALARTPHGHAYKGYVLLDAGRDIQAEVEFTQALKLDAQTSAARRGLRMIEKKRNQRNKGLFRRLFG